MKRLSIFILCLIMFSSCGGDGGGSDDPAPITNSAPSVPNLSYPTNNLVCTNNIITFQWSASTDEQNDAVSYQLEIATDNAFSQNLNSTINNGLTKQITLEKGKLYYWRLKAIDSKNKSSAYTSVYSFYTEGEGVVNHLPFAPTLLTPVLNSNQTKGTVKLSWTSEDADVSDVLKYDVYLGTASNPTEKVATDLTVKTFDATISNSGNYYWKVVVKDGKGGTTVGQVWNFKVN